MHSTPPQLDRCSIGARFFLPCNASSSSFRLHGRSSSSFCRLQKNTTGMCKLMCETPVLFSRMLPYVHESPVGDALVHFLGYPQYSAVRVVVSFRSCVSCDPFFERRIGSLSGTGCSASGYFFASWRLPAVHSRMPQMRVHARRVTSLRVLLIEWLLCQGRALNLLSSCCGLLVVGESYFCISATRVASITSRCECLPYCLFWC